jgi:cardiolipin synthase
VEIPVTNDTNIEILKNGSHAFPEIIKEIGKAKNFINIQYFIINGGIIFSEIEDLLIKKHNEGVKVRIGTDFVGNLQTSNRTYKKLKDAGIEFLMNHNSYPPFTTGKSNQRNHDKFIIIDNNVAIIGGMNIGDDYSHMYSKYGY